MCSALGIDVNNDRSVLYNIGIEDIWLNPLNWILAANIIFPGDIKSSHPYS